jgi:aspartate racemase
MLTNESKPIGVLGGMGPLATQLFYGMVIANTEAKRDQDHIDLIILNHASLPDRTQALLSNNIKPLYDMLLADCKFLENSGASHIVIPCNTAHYFADMLQAEINIPIINMIRKVVSGIKETKKDGTKVGILATDGTVQLGVYQKELEAAGLIAVLPSE